MESTEKDIVLGTGADPGFHKGGCLDGITESVQWLSYCHCCKWVPRKLRYYKSQEAKLYIANIAMKLQLLLIFITLIAIARPTCICSN